MKEYIKEVVGFNKEGEHNKKAVRIINDDGQYRIRIPKSFTEIINVDEEKDYFLFHLIPDEEGKNFRLEGELIRG